MTAGPVRALILDFDGVILDSNALKTEAFRIVFSRFPEHAAAMMAYHERYVSRSRYDKFGYLVEHRLGRAGDRAMIERLADDYAAVLSDRMDACAFVPGAREFLDDASAHVPLFLASVTPEPELLRLLDVHHLRHYFVRVFGCPPWTKTGAVGAVVQELGGARGLALVGDSAGDQHAASLHGVEFLARDSGLPFDPPIEAIRDVSAIASLLRSRFAR